MPDEHPIYELSKSACSTPGSDHRGQTLGQAGGRGARRGHYLRKRRELRKKKRKRFLTACTALLITASVVAGMLLLARGGVQVKVPDVLGMTFEAARRKISSVGLEIEVDLADRNLTAISARKVLSQDPEPGATAEKGELVTVRFTTGPGARSSQDERNNGSSDGGPSGSASAGRERVLFDVNNVIAHVSYLASTIGHREQGTAQEEAAAAYLERGLDALGLNPVIQHPIPIAVGGRVTRNVIAELPGTQRPGKVIVVGAHMDSKGGPGANDNATGCGVLLELARVLKENMRHVATLRFIFFGAEEVTPGGSRDDHHWGSRFYVRNLSMAERSRIVAMVSVDMVGTGSNFYANSMGISRPSIQNLMLEAGRTLGMRRRTDPGWSDHEPFEKAGIPSVWIEFTGGNPYHSPEDNILSVNWSNTEKAGAFLQDFFETYLTPERVDSL